VNAGVSQHRGDGYNNVQPVTVGRAVGEPVRLVDPL
jgi:hypothetical protein